MALALATPGLAQDLAYVEAVPLVSGRWAPQAVEAPRLEQQSNVTGFAWPVAPVFQVPMYDSLIDQSVDETKGVAIYVGFCREALMMITWNSGTVSGAIQMEISEDERDPGEWAPLGPVVEFSGTAPRKTAVQITGFQPWLRPRIATAIGSGTVTVRIGCN